MFRTLCVATIVAILFSQLTATLLAEDGQLHRGAEIYSQKCASCHGANGEGTSDNYPESLFGDKPTFDLTEVISATMPEGEPELCTGEDARLVAEWMQSAFYSPEAQARINPPKRKLSRLTVAQYRNSVADLLEGFRWFNQPNDQDGLTGRYFKSRHFQDKHKVIERLDAGINLNFGEGTPDKEKIENAEEFSIYWDGSLVVDETGWYEFIIKTENGGRLFVNDHKTELIDAWVKSGYDTDYRGSRFLLAGRLYPIKLEWFTFKEKTASIGLWWKTPHGVEHPIPARHLSPQHSPEVLVVETPFPPDDRSDGYIRGTSVSREWDEATTFAAIEAADKLQAFLPEIAKIKKDDNAEQRREKLRGFCETFAFRAFRRPLDDVQKKTYIESHFEGNADADSAVKRSLLSILKSPRFLYREVTGEQDLYTQVSRLSFALHDSIPSKDLLTAAQKQWVSNPQALRDQAWRLLNTYRGQVRLMEFFRTWMNIERLEDLEKDPELFPGFTPELVADLRASFELLLRDAATDDENGFQTLLTGREMWMNDRLAEYYQVDPPGGSEFTRVAFEPEHRAGFVSHPFLLAGFAYRSATSPIHRGVFLSRGVLGRALKPPPDSVAPLAPDLEPDLTTRERTAKQTSPAMCANCHVMINSLGFALEGFDAVGKLRQTEKDKPIDDSGQYRPRSGDVSKFQGATELADFLLKSPETHRSFCRQLFHHMVQQPILAYGPQTIDELASFFADHQFNMKQLMVEIACRSALQADSTD